MGPWHNFLTQWRSSTRMKSIALGGAEMWYRPSTWQLGTHHRTHQYIHTYINTPYTTPINTTTARQFAFVRAPKESVIDVLGLILCPIVPGVTNCRPSVVSGRAVARGCSTEMPASPSSTNNIQNCLHSTQILMFFNADFLSQMTQRSFVPTSNWKPIMHCNLN